ncbi:flavodoxin family protein [Clostridium sp. CX1]|uniref:Flavodoxin family protein n=1 Tax=Clostridium tanneri TaxID=3037988 RepID=A0ABU4JUX2_9CLOT|nr:MULTISPECIES: flavodoxin family protein [unclassified Clostridium]MCT8977065.1 flavodoxin family protein [Clostridium sp. CX1]MDW8801728.1 flavodoxin family protein [Clostridium sp. A1-XYC3]
MKIFSVLGSPNKNGNTAVLLKEFLRGVKESHSGVEYSDVFLQEKKISFCSACNSCRKSLNTCVIKDDMQLLYEEVKSSDIVVLATPVYWWNMTAQLKTFIDRLYALKSDDFKGKEIVLLMTHEGTEEDSGAKVVESSLEQICEYLGLKFTVKYGVSTGEIPVSENQEALGKAYDMGKSLIGK